MSSTPSGGASVALVHPVLRTAYLERGREVREAPLWTFPILTDPECVHVESTDPIRVTIEVSPGEADLPFLIGEDCRVTEHTLERPDASSG